jgi:hypothetical protein
MPFQEALYDEAIERISGFSVGLSGIDLREHPEVCHQSGSGTPIELDGNSSPQIMSSTISDTAISTATMRT